MGNKILVVEKNEIYMSELCRNILRVSPHATIYCTYNIERAYMIAMEQHIDLFFVSIEQNDDAIEDAPEILLAQKIRAFDEYEYAPFFYVTQVSDYMKYIDSMGQCFGYIDRTYNNSKIEKIISEIDNFKKVKGMLTGKKYLYENVQTDCNCNMNEKCFC